MGGQQSTRRLTVINDEATGVIKITDSVVDRLRIELDKSSVHHQQSQNVPEPPKEQTQTPLDPPQPPPPKIEPVVEVPEPVVAPPEPAPVAVAPPPPPPPPQQEVPPPPPPQSEPEPPPPPPKVEVEVQTEPAPVPQVPAPKEVSPAPPPKTIIQYIEKEQVQWEPVHSISSLRVKAEKEREMKEAEAYWNKRFVQQEKEHSAQAHLQMSALKSTAEKLAHMFGTERSLPICQEEKESVLLCYKQNSGESLKCSDAVKNFSRCVHSTRMVSG